MMTPRRDSQLPTGQDSMSVPSNSATPGWSRQPLGAASRGGYPRPSHPFRSFRIRAGRHTTAGLSGRERQIHDKEVDAHTPDASRASHAADMPTIDLTLRFGQEGTMPPKAPLSARLVETAMDVYDDTLTMFRADGHLSAAEAQVLNSLRVLIRDAELLHLRKNAARTMEDSDEIPAEIEPYLTAWSRRQLREFAEDHGPSGEAA